MERMQLPKEIKPDHQFFLNMLLDGAAPVPIVLDSAPTTANGLLKEGQRGLYGGFLYETVDGTTYKYGTAV